MNISAVEKIIGRKLPVQNREVKVSHVDILKIKAHINSIESSVATLQNKITKIESDVTKNKVKVGKVNEEIKAARLNIGTNGSYRSDY